ncbi:hypothetical protein EGT07_24390 [Herbaspirillum sp. HC18]|nr:hypothetical protein EGT07_24390 [Herbaspirillum sp. HC18]
MNRIRIGLLVDDLTVSAWVDRMLGLILRDEGMEIALIVRNGAPAASRRSSLLDAWKRLDGRLFKLPQDAFREVDGSASLAGIPSLVVTADGGRFAPQDIARVAAFELDVLIKLGFETLSGEILRTPRCGVWAYLHADRHAGITPENGALEVLSGTMTIGTALAILSDAAAGDIVLQRSWSATDSISLGRSLNAAYWKSASFIPRKLRELDRLGRAAFMERHERSAERLIAGNMEPDNGTVLRKLPALFGRKLLAKLRGRSHWQQWMLLYRSEKSGVHPDDFANFRQLVPPDDRFWADPFVVEHEGRHAIFIEELEYTDNTGYLSVIRFDDEDNPVLPPVPILKKPYHLSYPHVFSDGGVLYMIPETCQNGTIELYRSVRFPDKWEFVMNLMEGIHAVDTTVWKHNGKYWLFANVAETRGASTCDELFLYFSDALLSDRWQPHPCSPIVSDVRCARPAGRIFEKDGSWFRPAQDCSGSYGRAVQIQRIEHIDEFMYAETPAGRIDADWDKDIVCTHTLSRAGRLTCIDGMMVRKKGKRPANEPAAIPSQHPAARGEAAPVAQNISLER